MRRYISWQIVSIGTSALIFFPLLTLAWLSFSADSALWTHLVDTVLRDYIVSSLILMIGVGLVTLTLGIGSAYIVTQFDFAGVRFFNWALLLPLAMPAYITAYAYTGILDVAGPAQVFIRDSFGVQYGDYWFPEIRSIGGAIFVLSFVLYPYVYLLARASFLEQSQRLPEVAQLLGCNRRQAFFKITLPIARPAIVAGLSLALMETLADFGTVSYFGINTFTTGIYRTWNGFGSVANAAQLALMLLTFVVILLAIEKSSNKRAAYHTNASSAQGKAEKLTGSRQLFAIGLVSTPLLLGFVVPTATLFSWAIGNAQQLTQASFWKLITNTLILASVTAILAVSLALIVAYSYRISQSKISLVAKQIVGLGYAVPGLIIAVGTLIPLAYLDNAIDGAMSRYFGLSTGLVLSGSLIALIIAYLVRFLAVALKSVDSGLDRIAKNMDQAARSLGASPVKVLKRVHLPILRSSVLTGILIVFVDVMKELPATLVLRPINFNTLAVRAYEMASDERLSDAALPSIMIVLAGLLPVILLSRKIKQ